MLRFNADDVRFLRKGYRERFARKDDEQVVDQEIEDYWRATKFYWNPYTDEEARAFKRLKRAWEQLWENGVRIAGCQITQMVFEAKRSFREATRKLPKRARLARKLGHQLGLQIRQEMQREREARPAARRRKVRAARGMRR